jgi:hypothetical protein
MRWTDIPATWRARAIRSIWRPRAPGRSRGGRSSCARRRRSRACPGSRRRLRRATNAGTGCRVRSAGNSRRSSSLNCGGRRGKQERPSTFASIAAKKSRTIRSSRCWRAASGGRAPSAMARRPAFTSPVSTLRLDGSRGRTPPSSSSRRRRIRRCFRFSSTPSWARRGRCLAKLRSGRSCMTGASRTRSVRCRLACCSLRLALTFRKTGLRWRSSDIRTA